MRYVHVLVPIFLAVTIFGQILQSQWSQYQISFLRNSIEHYILSVYYNHMALPCVHQWCQDTHGYEKPVHLSVAHQVRFTALFVPFFFDCHHYTDYNTNCQRDTKQEVIRPVKDTLRIFHASLRLLKDDEKGQSALLNGYFAVREVEFIKWPFSVSLKHTFCRVMETGQCNFTRNCYKISKETSSLSCFADLCMVSEVH